MISSEKLVFSRRSILAAAALLPVLRRARAENGGPSAALTQRSHGLSSFGDLALPADFSAFPYVRPDAPKGGQLIMEAGGSSL